MKRYIFTAALLAALILSLQAHATSDTDILALAASYQNGDSYFDDVTTMQFGMDTMPNTVNDMYIDAQQAARIDLKTVAITSDTNPTLLQEIQSFAPPPPPDPCAHGC